MLTNSNILVLYSLSFFPKLHNKLCLCSRTIAESGTDLQNEDDIILHVLILLKTCIFTWQPEKYLNT